MMTSFRITILTTVVTSGVAIQSVKKLAQEALRQQELRQQQLREQLPLLTANPDNFPDLQHVDDPSSDIDDPTGNHFLDWCNSDPEFLKQFLESRKPKVITKKKIPRDRRGSVCAKKHQYQKYQQVYRHPNKDKKIVFGFWIIEVSSELTKSYAEYTAKHIPNENKVEDDIKMRFKLWYKLADAINDKTTNGFFHSIDPAFGGKHADQSQFKSLREAYDALNNSRKAHWKPWGSHRTSEKTRLERERCIGNWLDAWVKLAGDTVNIKSENRWKIFYDKVRDLKSLI